MMVVLHKNARTTSAVRREIALSREPTDLAPASGKSRALRFIALDKLANQDIGQAIIVVPEKSIGASFSD